MDYLLFTPNKFPHLFLSALWLEFGHIQEGGPREFNLVNGVLSPIGQPEYLKAIKKRFNKFLDEIYKEFSLSYAFKIIYRNSIELSNYDFKDEEINQTLYKYVSNESPYAFNFFQGKLFFADKKNFDDIYEPDIRSDKFDKNFRVLCLSRSNSINAMWGTYANKFKGYCFEYLTTDLIKSMQEQFCTDDKHKLTFCYGNIRYKNEKLPYGNLFYGISNETKQMIKDVCNEFILLFEKENSWQYQQETRFVVIKDYILEDFYELKTKMKVFYCHKIDSVKLTKRNDLIHFKRTNK